jgi:cytoskeletal protein RodZ
MIKIHKKFNSHKNKKIAALVVLVVVAIYALLAITLRLWPLQKKVFITASNVKNGLPSNHANTGSNSSGTASSSPVTQSDNPKAPAQISTNTKTLTAPSGTFANLYDASADTQMNSICNTTPGATCQVIFTKGSLSIALPAKTTDSSGSATWAWTPEQIGLGKGSWHITAKAILGSQTKTTDNGSLELVIHD